MEYALPAAAVVTPECRDLLSQLLVADPARRISLAELQRHPWFRRDLPPGVAGMNDRLLAEPAAYRSPAAQVRCAFAPSLLSTSRRSPLATQGSKGREGPVLALPPALSCCLAHSVKLPRV